MRHPIRWFSLCSVALAGGSVLAVWAFGWQAVARVVLLIAVLWFLAGLLSKEHQWGARLSIWTFVATALVPSAFAWIWGWLSASWWLKILFSLAVTPAMYLANAGFRADIRRGQRRREVVADAVAGRVVAGEPVGDPFALYLRPFATTERLPAQPLPSSAEPSEIPVHVDLETVFERALRGRCPIVALGSTGDIAEGAARITATNRPWRTVVAALADQSAFVVMVPLARPGTSWELQWLTEHHLLDKILMVMPETVGSVPSGVIRTTEPDDRIFKVGIQTWDAAEHQIDLPVRWRRAIKATRKIGIELPPLATVGAVFKIDADTRQVSTIMPLPLSTAARRAGYLRDAITSMGLFKFNPNPPPDLLSALTRAVFYRGRTLEFTLVRAADGFLLWGDPVSAAMLLSRAAREGSPHPWITQDYLEQLPALIKDRLQHHDDDAAMHYRAGIRVLLEHPEIATLTSAAASLRDL